MIKNFSCFFVFALVFVLSLVSSGFAQTEPQKDFPNVNIKNFGKMDDKFYRGAQPEKEDYKSLAALGIKTVIDLRNDPKEYAKSAAEEAGLKYVNIPMSDSDYPKPESIEALLKVFNDPETGIFYVHCAGGRHRTGVAGAIYRYTRDGWDYDRVYKEMKNYDFYTRWGHGVMKDFVVDYGEKMKLAQVSIPVVQTPNK